VKKLAFLASLGLILAPSFYAAPAQAQATRTWVSGVGDDVNPCSRTAPCKTFAGAISKTATGGEISVLDPGGFGAVTITKSITINGDGTLAGILSAGSPQGILVNITTALATDKVVIRNVSINGANTGTDGVRIIAGKEVILDNVTISGVTDAGIDIAQSAGSNVFLNNVRISKASVGVRTQSTAGVVSGVFDNVKLDGMTSHCFHAVNNTTLNIRNTEAARCTGDGFRSEAATVNLWVENSASVGNNIGVNAVAGAVRIHNVDMLANNTNVTTNVQSSGQNRSSGNTTTNTPTLTGWALH
jgi:hypothetical protein